MKIGGYHFNIGLQKARTIKDRTIRKDFLARKNEGGIRDEAVVDCATVGQRVESSLMKTQVLFL